jgi:hypothetical protein
MPSKLDDILPALIKAGDSGLTKAKIREKFAGKSKTNDRVAAMQEKLAALVTEGAISGPIKKGRSEHYFAGGYGPSMETSSAFDDIVPALIKAGDIGLTKAKIEEKFAGKSKAKDRIAALGVKLTALLNEEAIRGPFKFSRSEYYFVLGRGPSIETASKAIVGLVSKSGVKLLSKASLEKTITGKNANFFADGIKYAVASQAILELSCGNSKYYLHRDVAADYFGFEVAASETPTPPPHTTKTTRAATSLTLETVLPAYRRLKAEQGGFSAVKIFDLMQQLNGSKEDLHRLLIDETKAGRVTIHPSTSVNLPKEVVEAGIRLSGFPEPFITVVVKSEP